jgi:tight adherence protein B
MPQTKAQYNTSHPKSRLVLSPQAINVLVALLAALCIGGVLVALLYARMSKGSEARGRLAAIAAPDKPTVQRSKSTADTERKRDIETTLRELEEKQKIKAGAKPSLRVRLRQAGLEWSKKTYYLTCVITGAVTVVGLIAFRISALPALGFGLAGGLLLPHLYVSLRRARRFKKFTAEFPNAVDVIVRGVKSGLPLGDCLRIISSEAQEPVRSEFRTIVEDQTLGVPVDEAVQRLPERIPLAEANFFAIVIALQSRTGGSLSESLGNLSKVLRERKKIQQKIKAMSSEAKASAGIIGSLPIVVTSLVYLTSPDYMTLLFTTTIGHIVIAASLMWMGVGIFVMRKMINFDF